MNAYQIQLWEDLMTLVSESEAFYYADQQMGSYWFRIFNYRMASYQEFMRPNGTESRGHMFLITQEGHDAEPVALVSMPMEKFWNLNENPATMDLDLSTVVHVWDKLDGSLISTYMCGDALYLKSKGSLHSDHATAAMAWLALEPEFHAAVEELALSNYTVNFEWTSPDFRIVIGYEGPALRVLNVRNNEDGSYLPAEQVAFLFDPWVVEEVHVDDPVQFVAEIPEMTNIEGYVIQLASDQLVKIKTSWYLSLHRTKDTINSPRRLFEAVLDEASDDLRSLFFDDPQAIQMIADMEAFVADKFNHMVDTVERFYERNKGMTRKEYAILGQQEFKGTFYFKLVMEKYIGREFSYKEFMKSKWKELGLKDVEKKEDE